jgi:hypothetical protein
VTRKPLLWYSEAPNGSIEFYDQPGFHPKYAQELKPVTPEVVVRYEKQAARKKVESEMGTTEKLPSSVAVQSIVGYGKDLSDGSDVCFFTDYPNLSISDDPSHCNGRNALWTGSYKIQGDKLILEMSNLRAIAPPSHTLEVGYTVTLKGAEFSDKTRTRTIV